MKNYEELIEPLSDIFDKVEVKDCEHGKYFKGELKYIGYWDFQEFEKMGLTVLSATTSLEGDSVSICLDFKVEV